MEEYHKINTIYKRDLANKGKIIEGEWALPEFEYLQNNTWVFTEKVDGTNIRISAKLDVGETDDVYYNLRIGGRTDDAQIQVTLIAAIQKLVPIKKFLEVFPGGPEHSPHHVTLYGEGYGPKIQKGGGNYGQDQSFVLFDVRIGNWWLQREDVESIGEKLGLTVVPVIGWGTLHDAAHLVREGLTSKWGNFISEGLVMRPKLELRTRSNHRIIAKIKHRDFTGGSL